MVRNGDKDPNLSGGAGFLKRMKKLGGEQQDWLENYQGGRIAIAKAIPTAGPWLLCLRSRGPLCVREDDWEEAGRRWAWRIGARGGRGSHMEARVLIHRGLVGLWSNCLFLFVLFFVLVFWQSSAFNNYYMVSRQVSLLWTAHIHSMPLVVAASHRVCVYGS